MAPKLLTVKDLAALFQKDEETIRCWIREGDVFPSAFKVKDGWYVPMIDVKRLMRQRSEENSVSELDKTVPVRRSSKGFVREW